MRIGKGARLIFDAPSTINVLKRLWLGESATLAGVEGVTATDIRINYAGSADAVFGKKIRASVSLLAPDALVQLGEGGEYSGRVWALALRVGKGARVEDGVCKSHL
jgi:hypothetical protein